MNRSSCSKSISQPCLSIGSGQGQWSVSNNPIKHSPSFVDVSKAAELDPQQLLGGLEFQHGLNEGAFDVPPRPVELNGMDLPKDVPKEKTNEPESKLGAWILGKTIGEGSSGKVKLATHSRTNEKCVVKAVRRPKIPGSTYQPISAQVIQRIHKRELLMIREAALGVVLNHPNIVRLHSTVLGTNHFYCFFEYIPGYDLVDYITQLGRLSEEESRLIFRQMLSAIGNKLSLKDRVLASKSCGS
jgi:hypothetical protein